MNTSIKFCFFRFTTGN
ncbi:peptide IlvX [unidentified bacterial endosymbiont]